MTELTKWDQRFLDLAQVVGSWSKDPSSKVGAVIVDKNQRVISLGFNGAPKGVKEPAAGDRSSKLRRTVHGEANAILFARTNVEGFTIYTTHLPCSQCAAKIIQSGIKRVVALRNPDFEERWAEDTKESLEMFSEAGVVLVSVNQQ